MENYGESRQKGKKKRQSKNKIYEKVYIEKEKEQKMDVLRLDWVTSRQRVRDEEREDENWGRRIALRCKEKIRERRGR